MLGSKSHNLKSARLIARRRKILIGKIVLSTVCVSVIWFSVFYIFHLKTFIIDNIEVRGNVVLEENEITKLVSSYLLGDYFFTFPKSGIIFYPKKQISAQLLKQYPIISSVQIKARSLHEIIITIEERQTKYLLCQNDLALLEKKESVETCFAMDSKGFNFAKYSDIASTTNGLLRFYPLTPIDSPIGKNYLSEESFKKISNFVEGVRIGDDSFVKVLEGGHDQFEGVFSRGQRIIFSTDKDLSNQLDNLSTIINSEEFGGVKAFEKINYIDLRFENKIFYKSK